MVEEGHPALAASYGASSILVGFFAVMLATNLVRRASFAR
jgi:hypothetical protein